ncbi:MAG: CyaY protein [Bacteroidia bacterium]|jgi:CyaY protein
MDAAVTESEFNDLVDETLEVLETALDEVDEELDYQNAGGILTLEFENGSTMVFSRQPPTKELWLASRSGGFHFVYDQVQADWRDTRSEVYFRPFVVAQMLEHAGIAFDWG